MANVAIDFGKSTKNTPTKIDNKEVTKLATEIREAKRTYDNAKTHLDALKDAARDLVGDQLSPTKKAVVLGEGVECRYVAAYKPVPREGNEKTLRAALGDLFDLLFSNDAELKVKKAADIPKFIDICKKKKIDLDNVFEITDLLRPMPEFSKICLEQAERQPKKKDVIGSVEKQVRFAPRIYVK